MRIKFKHSIINTIKMVFLAILSSNILLSCVTTTEESIALFENRLESFIGKNVRDVTNALGKPTKYSNRPDNLPGESNGTYMIYDYRSRNDDCIILFKYDRKTLKIIDWDYEGNCLLFDGK